MNKIADELQTINDMLRWSLSRFVSADLFYGHGTDNHWDEVIQLILPTLFLPLDCPESICTAKLTYHERQCVVERVNRRVCERIPVAYLTNQSYFAGYKFYVDQRVLIPRSPIGELISQKFSGILQSEPKYILDMCTGSGCIAIACALAFPQAEVDAVDISNLALEVSNKNIYMHGVQKRVALICSDLFNELSQKKYDLIIANPPYVSDYDMNNLPNEYYHEPRIGLSGGKDGLIIFLQILTQVANYLSENGIFICEVGSSMGALTKKYPNIPFTWIKLEHGGEGVFMMTRKQIIKNQF
ncbi:50S ribosomal protein L3 N(5)-glutamine methyltransferase [Candidatus Erwinia haradaeae]|nr:50S ribosomal protein L3 N(5)-glutamine methyltransferase [Candidatus Erwinia haradaeae]